MTPEALATELLTIRANGSNPGAHGWVREDKQRDALAALYPTVEVTRHDTGETLTVWACASCGRLLTRNRDMQRCHVVPSDAIRTAADALARQGGIPDSIRTKVTGRVGDARRWHRPGNWRPGCYGCNDDHEQ